MHKCLTELAMRHPETKVHFACFDFPFANNNFAPVPSTVHMNPA